ncbi:Putative ALA-interacting subunit 2 [Morus notabilis]|uniref:Putative ALA-interacting subunit 2 n=1 Tax=Morus notabilis TaxID=981085 RepID=W9QC92_9ROSA|nr:Putative ALA-interacting subunit 2 [Morus notabilis]
MDVDEGSTSGASIGAQSTQSNSRPHKAIYQFTQQSLPACKPVLTPAWVIGTFLVMGIVFIPTGFITLRTSRKVVEIVDHYDTECIPESFRSNKVAYMKDSSIHKNCSRFLKVVEIVDHYDTECIPESFRSNKVAYMKDSSIHKNCSRFLKIEKHMKAPIHIYYQLDNYYQNHRR